MRLASCGKFKFSRAAQLSTAAGELYGGVVSTDATQLAAADTDVGLLHHRRGMYATGLLRMLPPGGATNFEHVAGGGQFRTWEPEQYFGRARQQLRRPKTCIIFSQEDFAADFDPLFDPGLGVFVAIAAPTAASTSVLTQAFPVVSAELLNDAVGDYLSVAHLDPAAVAGGELLVIDANADNWGYSGYASVGEGNGGGTEFSRVYTVGQDVQEFDGCTSFAAEYDDPLTPGEVVKVRVYFRDDLVAYARNYLLDVEPRFGRLRHVVAHGSDGFAEGESFNTPLDDAAIFDYVAGDIPFAFRRRYDTGDTAGLAALVAEEIADFFAD